MAPRNPTLSQIDIHTHVMPLPLLEWLASQGLADLRDLDRGAVMVDPRISGLPDGVSVTCRAEAYDVGARLAAMDRTGVEIQAVSISPYLLGAYCEDDSLVAELVARGNDEVAAFVATAPERFVGLGAVPVGRAQVVEEARRCLEVHRMAGVMLATHGVHHELADSIHDDLWPLLAAHRAFTFLHPVAGAGGYGEEGVAWTASVAAAVDLALSLTGMMRAGILERHDFPLCLAYGGGAVPSIRGLMQHGWEQRQELAHLQVPPMEQLKGLYYDTATFDVQQLRDLVQFVGPAHVLMGSDFPSRSADPDPIGTVAEAQLGPVQEMIMGVNAASLLGLRADQD